MYSISKGEGIIKVTGEVGSGKTMLCRMLQTRLPKTVETIYLANPSVSRDEILHAIAFELQLPVPRDANRIEVMHRINDHLLERHGEGKHVVLFVEESQSMPLETLEEVRLLSNLETSHHKLLQIVLFGQPELNDHLRLPEIRQLRERITHSFALKPLTPADVRRYLTFRLRAAGYRGPDLFSGRVIRCISRTSQGLTRRVNIIADKALLAAFADGTHNVSIKHVKAAVRDTEFAGTVPSLVTSPLGYVTAGVLVGAAIGVVALVALQDMRQAHTDNQTTALSAFWKVWNSGLLTRRAPADALLAVKGETPVTPSNDNDSASANQRPAETPAATSPADEEPVQTPVASSSAHEEPVQTPVSTPISEEPVASPPTNVDDLLEQRLRETERWLSETDESQLTIQLLGSSNADLLRDDLAEISNVIELKKVFVYRTLANKRPSYTVLLGTYGSRAEAFREMDTLPDSMKANGPYFRTIKGVKAEIALNGV